MKTRFIDLKAVWLIMVCALCLASCRNNDYVRSIPASATAVMRIDGAVVAQSDKVLSLLPFGDKAAEALDLSRDIYAFETIDGNLGMCAKVKDSDRLLEIMKKAATSEVRRQGDYRLADINNSWAVGFDDNALLVLGPVSAAALPDAQRSLVRMLKQDEDASILARPMYSRLDSIDSRVALVAQVQALPEKLAAPFMLGAPKGADASQVAVAAGVDVKDGIMRIDCENFSFQKSVDVNCISRIASCGLSRAISRIACRRASSLHSLPMSMARISCPSFSPTAPCRLYSWDSIQPSTSTISCVASTAT